MKKVIIVVATLMATAALAQSVAQTIKSDEIRGQKGKTRCQES